MTAPPEKLRTHHRGAESAGEHQQLEQPLREFLRCDVVRVPAERRMSPTEVDRCGAGAPATTEQEPLVGDPAAANASSSASALNCGECRDPGIAARPRSPRSHRRRQFSETRRCPGRVTQRPNRRRHDRKVARTAFNSRADALIDDLIRFTDAHHAPDRSNHPSSPDVVRHRRGLIFTAVSFVRRARRSSSRTSPSSLNCSINSARSVSSAPSCVRSSA